jgi:hypothetical protein
VSGSLQFAEIPARCGEIMPRIGDRGPAEISALYLALFPASQSTSPQSQSRGKLSDIQSSQTQTGEN